MAKKNLYLNDFIRNSEVFSVYHFPMYFAADGHPHISVAFSGAVRGSTIQILTIHTIAQKGGVLCCGMI